MLFHHMAPPPLPVCAVPTHGWRVAARSQNSFFFSEKNRRKISSHADFPAIRTQGVIFLRVQQLRFFCLWRHHSIRNCRSLPQCFIGQMGISLRHQRAAMGQKFLQGIQVNFATAGEMGSKGMAQAVHRPEIFWQAGLEESFFRSGCVSCRLQ